MAEFSWEASAQAWITDQGEHGDFGRRYVLDPVMLPLATRHQAGTVLDVGCGEGRFCRMLQAQGIACTGLDPTPALLAEARRRDANGTYVEAGAEQLPFADGSFDLVISYLSLIDIPDISAAIPEMARVLKPGGRLLVANLTSFNTAGAPGWVRSWDGRKLHYALDRYSEARPVRLNYRNIRVVNHHRPLGTYMQLFLSQNLRLTHFSEPLPVDGAPEPKAADFKRAPNFCVMEWEKPG
jgi:SAM-dependent methyltransferase